MIVNRNNNVLRCIQMYRHSLACLSYLQGQSPEPRIREYFYYVDHQGMLFLDDSKMKNFTSCFKDKKFLEFFFKRIEPNKTSRYQIEFPFVSMCGRERNFVRCDDRPIVFTHLVDVTGKYMLQYGHVGHALAIPFAPDKLTMIPATGRVYHPAPENIHPVGLVSSKLAIELSQFFTFADGDNRSPTHFTWDKKTYVTDNTWYTQYLGTHTNGST